ncbi:hypothetical protein KIH87_10435 [Paraneptunicella aestuarii]|uniref:hypothetical protein n=1 Tax=Paraneptunicella aestuarii TaxID=2831148 RepID=UPI001E5525F0|nr:hypothetical protein [Paraneptunicella aestuarii]UAA37165.1 hypothetical protein KIH87_10435 [Paraneptunicella aestuarii]
MYDKQELKMNAKNELTVNLKQENFRYTTSKSTADAILHIFYALPAKQLDK